jgi:hypothetical protein
LRRLLENLGFDRGAALLLKRALRVASEGEAVTVTGRAPDLFIDLRAWCRAEGHDFGWPDAEAGGCAVIVRGSGAAQRWAGAERAGCADPLAPGAVLDHPPQGWGLAARGALVESGSPDFHFALLPGR